VGATAPPFETDFLLLSSDFSPKYSTFIITAPPFCLTAPTFKNSWIRHWHIHVWESKSSSAKMIIFCEKKAIKTENNQWKVILRKVNRVMRPLGGDSHLTMMHQKRGCLWRDKNVNKCLFKIGFIRRTTCI
jgi:hypothetical protein